MTEEQLKMRNANRRRGARSRLVFRVLIGACVVGLLWGLMSLSGRVVELRNALTELEASQSPSVAPAPAPGPAPATGESVRPEDLESLKEVLVGLQGELGALRTRQAQELEQLRLAAEAEQRRLKERLAALEALVAAQEEEPAPGPVVEVIPPPEDGEEDPSLVPDPPESGSGDPDVPGPVVGEGGTGESPPPEPEPEPEPDFTEYTIRRGDTISVIARRFKVETEELLALNGIEDPRRIQIGQVLKIPK